MEEKKGGTYLHRCEKLRELNDRMLKGEGDTEIARYLLKKDITIKGRFDGIDTKNAVDTLRKAITSYRNKLFDGPDAPRYATDAYVQRYDGKINYINILDNQIAFLQERMSMRHTLDRKIGIPSKQVLEDIKVIAKVIETSVDLKERMGLLNSIEEPIYHREFSQERYDEISRKLDLCADPQKVIQEITGIPSLAPNKNEW